MTSNAPNEGSCRCEAVLGLTPARFQSRYLIAAAIDTPDCGHALTAVALECAPTTTAGLDQLSLSVHVHAYLLDKRHLRSTRACLKHYRSFIWHEEDAEVRQSDCHFAVKAA